MMKMSSAVFVAVLCVVLSVGLIGGAYVVDCPEPVVDTVYIDSFYSFSRGDSIWVVTCTDSIAVLNEMVAELLDIEFYSAPNSYAWYYAGKYDSLFAECADLREKGRTIDSLNEALTDEIDSLKQHIEWVWDLQIEAVRPPDPCAGIIAAVDSLLENWFRCELHPIIGVTRWTHPAGNHTYPDHLQCITEWQQYKQRLKEGRR